jgi:hypothetical protein
MAPVSGALYNDYRSRLTQYNPLNSDIVDQMMSDFINLHPDRHHLRLLFVREGDGWYQFGTKRVNVKSEKNLLKVRVGGGFCTIDDYVDQNLPFEVARLNNDTSGRSFKTSSSAPGKKSASKSPRKSDNGEKK